MLKISCAGCLGLSSAIWAEFTHKICVAAWNRKKIHQNVLFWKLKVVPRARNFVTKNESPSGSEQWRFRDSGLHCFDRAQGCDSRTDRHLGEAVHAVASKNSDCHSLISWN